MSTLKEKKEECRKWKRLRGRDPIKKIVGGREGRGEEDRQTDRPCKTKPLISTLKRLTSQDTNTPPPPGVMMMVLS
jgi:hypothetical protein